MCFGYGVCFGCQCMALASSFGQSIPSWLCCRYKHSLKKAEEASAQLAKDVRDLATGPLQVVVSEEMLTCLWPEEIVAAARGTMLHAMGFLLVGLVDACCCCVQHCRWGVPYPTSAAMQVS